MMINEKRHFSFITGATVCQKREADLNDMGRNRVSDDGGADDAGYAEIHSLALLRFGLVGDCGYGFTRLRFGLVWVCGNPLRRCLGGGRRR